MNTKQANLVILLMIAAGLIYGGILYSKLPPIIATHFDGNMHANGWGPKWTTIILFPIAMIVFLVLLNVMPRMNLQGPSVLESLPAVNTIVVGSAFFMLFMNILIMEMPLQPGMPFNKLMMTGLLVLFLFIGSLYGKLRRNAWCGIRTKQTLESDAVWDATHRLAARLTIAGSLIGIAAIWLGAPVWTAIVIVLAVSLIPVVYSYTISKDLK